ncbi:MAG: bifunctional 3,4-dihydroxy-2-butanone-4-phosphate synthase/GTP cyclohydrolase II [Bacteroidota bacterium]|jgi:3,4-dihydroxy 2-butanone 4-phosphate synthase/GTP cyclohydrolase II|nr:bifunctional 3,4-dihydroxy-2-butanone-4-phosphate synthase/GTP cyclohydrolase II [Bacteroidota bacterium]NLP21017.1 bifunctional 3,4-dihydroxy-2-butanone-4-phosphate synthase/GTP cyclohydrolase II [Bacteroidales bacterium]OQC46514.1 MAG: Riboflavin biosynthesis protein RibBA [Bacteroidetes bacterium ADurb.Bin028]HNY43790.1 bifunctional 3,4-dihydroxy-2-butanone-4-phosphate synthase/GTP cyclohydrolase II [Bacteroidales bacterium]HOD88043.1 bifunctional 3,4-dihydroxy-2-butanone-4-phosphate synt
MSGNPQNEINRPLNTIEEAIEDIKNGKVVIVVDDYDRENEGDFVVAAEKITPEIVNFMATHGRGLICAPLTESRCKELELELMVGKNTALHETPFTVSVDLNGHGCTTGISAADRAKTIYALIDDKTKPEDLGRPGHIFPLMARENGVLKRAGHTEAVVDLTRLAGLKVGGALVEIMNEDGTMARLPQLMKIADKFKLKIISIEDLIKYRLEFDSLIIRGDKVKLPTDYGNFEMIPFKQTNNGLEHSALIKGSWEPDEQILVRIHSSCVTGDIFASQRCDCGHQLHESMKMIEKAGKGVIVYLDQEGRGIGLMNKISAYKLQEKGLDTVEANLHLGFKADERDYGVGAQILRSLGVRKMTLITNNPSKKAGLKGYGLEICAIQHIEIKPNKFNKFYLKTKKDKMGHELNLGESE